jgi:hypothetical protein
MAVQLPQPHVYPLMPLVYVFVRVRYMQEAEQRISQQDLELEEGREARAQLQGELDHTTQRLGETQAALTQRSVGWSVGALCPMISMWWCSLAAPLTWQPRGEGAPGGRAA